MTPTERAGAGASITLAFAVRVRTPSALAVAVLVSRLVPRVGDGPDPDDEPTHLALGERRDRPAGVAVFERGSVGGRERHPGAEAVADLHFQRRLWSKRTDRDREGERLPGDGPGRACGLGQTQSGRSGADVGRDVREVVGGVGVWSGGPDGGGGGTRRAWDRDDARRALGSGTTRRTLTAGAHLSRGIGEYHVRAPAGRVQRIAPILVRQRGASSRARSSVTVCPTVDFRPPAPPTPFLTKPTVALTFVIRKGQCSGAVLNAYVNIPFFEGGNVFRK